MQKEGLVDRLLYACLPRISFIRVASQHKYGSPLLAVRWFSVHPSNSLLDELAADDHDLLVRLMPCRLEQAEQRRQQRQQQQRCR